MEHVGFLSGPHQNNYKKLKIVSWNINGAKTKLDKPYVINFLSSYDIIYLNEVKTPCRVILSGYISYRSKSENGTASH